MLLQFAVGNIYLLDVSKCIHLVSGGTHSTFPEICYGALLSRLLEISAIKIFYYYYYLRVKSILYSSRLFTGNPFVSRLHCLSIVSYILCVKSNS